MDYDIELYAMCRIYNNIMEIYLNEKKGVIIMFLLFSFSFFPQPCDFLFIALYWSFLL